MIASGVVAGSTRARVSPSGAAACQWQPRAVSARSPARARVAPWALRRAASRRPAAIVHAARGGDRDADANAGAARSLPEGYDSALARANLLAQLSDVDAARKKKKGKKAKKKDTAATDAIEGAEGAEESVEESAEESAEEGAEGSAESAAASAAASSADESSSARAYSPWLPYPADRPGQAGGPPLSHDELRWSPNGNALLQTSRQTIPYNQFIRDLMDDAVKEVHWIHQDGLDRYFLVYHDDRVAYVQVPADDWMTTDLMNKNGLKVFEITEEGERDMSTGEYMSASDNSAQLFTQYGVPLIGVGVVWFIVWTMNRFKGDFDDRQKILEMQRREEAMSKVENDPRLTLLIQQRDAIDPDASPAEKERWERLDEEVEVLRAKLQARARFLISEEGGGPGGGQQGGGESEAVGKFMKVDGMRVIGKRDASDEGDAVKSAMDAAKRAKAEDDAKRAAKKGDGGDGGAGQPLDKVKGMSQAESDALDEAADAVAREKVARDKARKTGKLGSKMKMRDESEVVKFTDVAGIGDAKIELAEIVDFFRKPEKFKASGAKVPKGVMLTGPPGCGKTLLARAVAGESGATFFSLTASEFVEMFVGVGAARVRDLFAQAKKQAPSIIFIDELDAIGRPRGAGGSGNDERDQTLNQLLVELDGFGSDSKVVCIAATNRIDVLDKALVRAGRFDRKITVQLPTREGRLQILKVHVREKPLAPDVDLLDLAAEMNGFSGAIIANVVNNACLAAAREGRENICQANFDAAVEAEQLGKTLPVNRGEANDRRLARVHAACAVATELLMKDACKLNFVSIIPRETNLDGCVSLKDFPEVERPGAMTRAILTRHTRACFVPQLAEEEHYGFDDVSFAAAPYTARAREIATMMVTSAGMAREGSRLNYVPATDQFMIADFLRSDVVEFLLRSTTADRYFESDREARAMLQEEHAAARRFVKRQKAAIDAVADALFEKKSLDGEAVAAILRDHAAPEPEDESGVLSPEMRDRLEPWTEPMPEGSVPATNEWIET